MKDRLVQLLIAFKEARTATQITLAISTLAILAVATLSSWLANRPDFVEVFSGLSAAQAADYKSALAEAGIPFHSSWPPGPYTIWVDESDHIQAEAQVALAGYKPQDRGIQTTSAGAGTAFMSAQARQQMNAKREWQECELLLETLDFVERATVAGSAKANSAFAQNVPPTISVTLGLRHGHSLDNAQTRSVANLVRARFNVPLENITVSDEGGTLLHDGANLANGLSGDDLLEQKMRYDTMIEAKVNRQLDRAYGPNLAEVSVNSEWSHVETEMVKESADTSAPFFEKKTTTTNTNAGSGSAAGGPPGSASNITADFGNGNAAPGGGSSQSQNTLDEKAEETRSVVGRTTEHTVRGAPELKSLGITLSADTSLEPKLEDLIAFVKGAVRFDEDRDTFGSTTNDRFGVVRDEEGNLIPPAAIEPVQPPNQYLMLLLEYGVEVGAALAFILVLLGSLRGNKVAKKKEAARVKAKVEEAVQEEAQRIYEAGNIDPELLARAQVEELVRSDPEKVGEILARWAVEETEKVGAGA